MHKSIAIREEFANDQGQLLNYDAYDGRQRFALPMQKHADIRTFDNAPTTTRAIMLHLDQFTVDELNPHTLAELESDVVIRPGESWTVGTQGKQPDRNNWQGIEIVCLEGTTVTQSVIPKVPN